MKRNKLKTNTKMGYDIPGIYVENETGRVLAALKQLAQIAYIFYQKKRLQVKK